jgi:hypothetical protein
MAINSALCRNSLDARDCLVVGYTLLLSGDAPHPQGAVPESGVALLSREGVVRITAKRRHWTKNVERLCGTELAPLGKSGGAVQLEIFAAVEMALLIEMIVYG